MFESSNLSSVITIMAGQQSIDLGSLTEARAIAKLLECGWEVAEPRHLCQVYDLVIRHPSKKEWKTVQIKTAYWHRGKYRVVAVRACNPGRIRRGERNYKDGDFDIMLAVDGQDFYLIPWSVVKTHKSTMMVSSDKYNKYKI